MSGYLIGLTLSKHSFTHWFKGGGGGGHGGCHFSEIGKSERGCTFAVFEGGGVCNYILPNIRSKHCNFEIIH